MTSDVCCTSARKRSSLARSAAAGRRPPGGQRPGEAARAPAREAEPAARPENARELARRAPRPRRLRGAEGGDDDVEGLILEREVLGVGLDPLQLDPLRLRLAAPGLEGADDALDGLRRVDRMESREDEMAGLRGRQGDLDRLAVAHFTHQDHLRRLS